MLQKFEVNGIHLNVDKKLQDYVDKKIGTLDRFVPKHARISAHGAVHLKDTNTKDNRYACMVDIRLPHQTLVAHESADSIGAAIDKAENALKLQLKKYKDMHASGKTQRHLMARTLRTQNDTA